MNTLRTRDELESLKSHLNALRRDLREVVRDVGALTEQASRTFGQASTRDWMDWARSRIGSREDLDETWFGLRERGERSAQAMRSTMQEHPAAAIVGALALGLVLAWFMSRSARQ